MKVQKYVAQAGCKLKLKKFLRGAQTFIFWCAFNKNGLRWPNTVFAHAFADAIQHVHKDFKKQTCRQ